MEVCACGISTASREGHNRWDKGTMFYFMRTLSISPDLDPLVSSVCGDKALLSVGCSMGIKDFDVDISPFITATPKAIGGNIQPGPISCYCRGSAEDFTCDRLQYKFDTDIIADFRQPAANCVTDLIMPDRGEPPLGTR